jgi:iron complex transport system ATP-binding protein
LSTTNLVEISDLSASLGSNQVLRSVSFGIGAGEFVGLLGPNGTGKSTLLRAICGLIQTTGKIKLQGSDLAGIKPAARASHFAYVAQEHEIAWPIRVEDLVALGRSPFGGGPGMKRSAADQRAIEHAMARMDIAGFGQRPVTQLSGGEKARVLIARALAQDAPLLIADEPTAGLDPSHQIDLMKTFGSMAEDGRSVIASLHDLGLAARWCSRLILLDQGRIVADGTPADVLTAENLEAVYGIRAHLGSIEGKLVVQPLDSA